jgi:hypothetical protein
MTCIVLCLHVMSDVFHLNITSDSLLITLFHTHPMAQPILDQFLVSFFDGVYVDVVFQLHPGI